MIRLMHNSDIPGIRKLHEEQYPDLECFLNRPLLASFVMDDPVDGSIVMAGGIEGIAEALILTDRTKSRIKIGKALVEAQRFSLFTCGIHNIQELYAFVTDEEYAKHLIQHGFQKREDTVLRMRIPHG